MTRTTSALRLFALARWLFTLAVGMATLTLIPGQLQAATARKPIEVRVVIVTTWEVVKNGEDVSGELHNWLIKWPLKTQIPFPVGEHALQYDPKSHVLAILTGMATARASASIMALGLDPRFDLSHAYWIVTGTAGVNPKVASVGSAAWAHWVIDGDLTQELDSRDMPADWTTGILPYGKTKPYEQPAPSPHTDDANVAYDLNSSLVDWAYAQTRDLRLTDDENLKALRAPYAGQAQLPPFVLEGDGLMSASTWYGPAMEDWAEQWVPYWTGGKGVFVMSAEEDTGIMQALTFLSRDKRARLDRVLILRSGSDFTVQPPGMTAADFIVKEVRDGFPATPEALDSLYTVASPVAHFLADHWATTRDTTPGRMGTKP